MFNLQKEDPPPGEKVCNLLQNISIVQSYIKYLWLNCDIKGNYIDNVTGTE